jgi:peptide/nickel transport system substrate-binding protein
VNPPLTHVLPPSLTGSVDNNPYPYDADKAKQMLAAAGVASPTIKVLYRNASEGSSKAFATLQQDLSKVGVTVQGVPSPNADFYTKYLQQSDVASRGVWDIAISGWGADWYGNGGAISYFLPLFSGQPSFPPIGSNYGYYDSPQANALIQQALSAPDTSTQNNLFAQVDKQIMTDAAIYPITNVNWPTYRASQLHNAVYMDALQNFDPANVWLDPAKNGG